MLHKPYPIDKKTTTSFQTVCWSLTPHTCLGVTLRNASHRLWNSHSWCATDAQADEARTCGLHKIGEKLHVRYRSSGCLVTPFTVVSTLVFYFLSQWLLDFTFINNIESISVTCCLHISNLFRLLRCLISVPRAFYQFCCQMKILPPLGLSQRILIQDRVLWGMPSELWLFYLAGSWK